VPSRFLAPLVQEQGSTLPNCLVFGVHLNRQGYGDERTEPSRNFKFQKCLTICEEQACRVLQRQGWR